MRKKMLIYLSIIILVVIIGIITFFMLNNKKSKKISIMSYDNKEEFVLYNGKIKNYSYSERDNLVGFSVKDSQAFIDNYVLTNDYYVEHYIYYTGDSFKNEFYEFNYKTYPFIIIFDDTNDEFILENSYLPIDTTFGNYMAIFPHNLISDLPNDLGYVDINYNLVYPNIKIFSDLVLWYEKYNCSNVIISEDKTKITVDIYSVVSRVKSEDYHLIITNDNKMIISK